MPGAQEAAETLALQALAWIGDESGRLLDFLEATGVRADMLVRLAGDPAFLGAVLDFVLADEARVLAFAAAAGVAPDRPGRARMALPGWTGEG